MAMGVVMAVAAETVEEATSGFQSGDDNSAHHYREQHADAETTGREHA